MARFTAASTKYGGWSGTVGLDDPSDQAELLRIVGLKASEWVLCGVSLSSGADVTVSASLLAVRRSLVRTAADWERVAREHRGAVPVTEFELPRVSALNLLGTFKRASIRAVPRLLHDRRIELDIVDTVPCG